ncbi:hypothetical protein [Oleiagrimonas sp. C23AA]|uniref:hypothetical protein n=1 Tax=Oleiagrimonas sp. C23AA TaxID=2719047 RepID=UPI001420E90A|nr:hypothetical protein [Oleiagrimonas sp. C23AA]NII10117.1 hypothetical protein [Oleiagrimonas sp. C23AA]
MHLFRRMAELARCRRLAQQLYEIEDTIEALPAGLQVSLSELVHREMRRAERSPHPHLYGTPPEQLHHTWGTGTDIGFSRIYSDSAQVRMRGVALWLTAAYYELRNSHERNAEALQRRLCTALRRVAERGLPERGGHIEWDPGRSALA